MTDDPAPAAETVSTVNEMGAVEGFVVAHDDPIVVERKIGATQASVALMSGLIVTGAWAAGDSQAYRRLIVALVEVADGATARVDRASRLIDDMTTGARLMRDQLRVALDDVDLLHGEREALKADVAHRVGELMAEIVSLKAELAAAHATPTITADAARVLTGHKATDMARALADRDNAQRSYASEKRRADAAVAQMQAAANQVDIPVEPWFATARGQFYQKAVDATRAAEEAFEGASWKEGARYLKLASAWTGLLNAVASQETASAELG
jgi:hypothetical protein